MDYDINKYFINLIHESRSIDIAESEFRRSLADDEELKAAYRRWCEEEGYSEKTGFSDFFAEYIEGRNEVWESLTDYDDEQ